MMQVGQEDTPEGRVHDYKVCKEIVSGILSQKTKIQMADIRFKVTGKKTGRETACLRVTLKNGPPSYEAVYYPSEVDECFDHKCNKLKISQEKFKEIGMGHIIHERLLRFKANIEEDFEKRKI